MGNDHVAAMPILRYGGFWIRVVATLIDGFVLGIALDLLGAASPPASTLGKRAVGLRVVTEQGGRISHARSTGRYFAKIVSGLLLLVGFLMVAFTERKRGLHDMLAGTVVAKDD